MVKCIQEAKLPLQLYEPPGGKSLSGNILERQYEAD